jgi:hypothetical protein
VFAGMSDNSGRIDGGWLRAARDWLCGDHPDYLALQRRKVSPAHRVRRRICRGLWIASGTLMAVTAELSVTIGLALATTFLCFAVLDEH